jgi:hypothetical protein
MKMRFHPLLLLFTLPASAWQLNNIARLQGSVVQASNKRALPNGVRVTLKIPQCRPDPVELDQNGAFLATCAEPLAEGRLIDLQVDAPGWEAVNTGDLRTEAFRPPHQLTVLMRPVPKAPARRPKPDAGQRGANDEDVLKASVSITGDGQDPRLVLELSNQRVATIGVRDLILHLDHVFTIQHAVAPIQAKRAFGNEVSDLLLPASGFPNHLQRRIRDEDGVLGSLRSNTVTYHLRDDSGRGDRDQVYVVRIEIRWIKDDVERQRSFGPFSFAIAGDRKKATLRTLSEHEAEASIADDQRTLRADAISHSNLTTAFAGLRSEILGLRIRDLEPDLDFPTAVARASRDGVHVLLLAGISDEKKWATICSAAKRNSWDGIGLILDLDGSLRLPAPGSPGPCSDSRDGSTSPDLLQMAARARRGDVVKKLIAKGADAAPALISVAGAGDVDMTREILNDGVTPSADAFCSAVARSRLAVISLMLERKAEVPDRCWHGLSIVKAAVDSFDSQSPEVLKIILTKTAARQNVTDPSSLARVVNEMLTGQQPFGYQTHWPPAELARAEELLRILLDAGALPGLIGGGAIAAAPSLAKLLVKAGANVNIERGKALETAVTRENAPLCKTLLELGASRIRIPVEALFHPIVTLDTEMVECLSRAGAAINQPFQQKKWDDSDVPFDLRFNRNPRQLAEWTPLILASSGETTLDKPKTEPENEAQRNRSLEMVRTIIRLGANVNRKTSTGQTAFSVNRWAPPMVRALLDAGSDVNVRDIDGNTVLNYYVNRLDRQMVRLLLDHGADPNLKDGKGQTPLDVAANKEWRLFFDENSPLFERKAQEAERNELRRMLIASGGRKK